MIRSRNVLGPLLLGLLLFVGAEAILRIVAPQDLRTEPLIGSSLAVSDSLLGHVLRPGAQVRLTGPEFSVTYSVGEHGLRDRDPHADRDGARVLLVGDSFAFGAGVPYAEIWPVRLETALREQGHKVEIVKAGVPGYDTRSVALALPGLLETWAPDHVLLAFLPNDFMTNRAVGAPALDPPTARDKVSSLHLITAAKRLALSNDAIYARLYLLSGRREFFVDPPSEAYTRQIGVTETLLQGIQDACREAGASFTVVSIPQQFQVLVASRGSHRIDPHRIDHELGAEVAARGGRWISTLVPLAEAHLRGGEDLFYRLDGHLNARGSGVLAGIVASEVGPRLP